MKPAKENPVYLPQAYVTCLECRYSDITAIEVWCRHPHHPGLTMAKDVRFERSELGFVTGQEGCRHCCDFKPKLSPKITPPLPRGNHIRSIASDRNGRGGGKLSRGKKVDKQA